MLNFLLCTDPCQPQEGAVSQERHSSALGTFTCNIIQVSKIVSSLTPCIPDPMGESQELSAPSNMSTAADLLKLGAGRAQFTRHPVGGDDDSLGFKHLEFCRSVFNDYERYAKLFFIYIYIQNTP